MAKWLELSVGTTPEYVEPLSELFRRYGEGGVVVQLEGDWDPDNDPADPGPPTSVTVTTYIPLDSTTGTRREMIDVGVRLISHLQPLAKLQERVLEETEWEEAWKAHFTLLRVGERLVIKPTWQEYSPGAQDVIVELDPGMAFGTGHHPTTHMCLEEIDRRAGPGLRVLDVGTGSGILSIAAAKLGAEEIVALDLDETALVAARDNIHANGVAAKVRVFQGTLPHVEAPHGGFDLVVANITARAIATLAAHIADVLSDDGVLAASGIITERQAEAEEALAAVLEITERRYDGDWVLLLARHSSRPN